MAAVAHSEGAPPRGKDAQLNIEVDVRVRDLFHAACRIRGTTARNLIEQYMREIIEETCPRFALPNDGVRVKTFNEQETTGASADDPNRAGCEPQAGL